MSSFNIVGFNKQKILNIKDLNDKDLINTRSYNIRSEVYIEGSIDCRLLEWL